MEILLILWVIGVIVSICILVLVIMILIRGITALDIYIHKNSNHLKSVKNNNCYSKYDK